MKTKTFLRNLVLITTLAILAGCASVPMASKGQDAASKTFKVSSQNVAGLYVYRDSFMGKALRKRVSVDGKVIGETANKTYFHKEVAPGSHTLSTESEFGDNELTFDAVAGKNYFYRQYIKMGAFTGGAGLEAVSEAEGQEGVLECNEAKSP